MPHIVSQVSVEPVMFCLGPETSKIICEKEGINSSNFAAQYGMYFHSQEQGIFFMNLGRVKITQPFTTDFGGIQSRKWNNLYLANKLLSSGEVKNVFFNVGENEAVIEDRMLILLQCKQRPLTSGINKGGDDTYQKVRFSRQVEDDRQENKIISPFKIIVVNIAKLMTVMYQGNLDIVKGQSDQRKTSIAQQVNHTHSQDLRRPINIEYVEKEDSEILQIVEIFLPKLNFEDMILDKTFFTRKFGIIGQASWKEDHSHEDSDIFPDNKVQAQAEMDTKYLFQIPLTTIARDISAEQRISGQIFSLKGGIRLPSNPQIQNRLTLKVSSQNLDSRQRNASINGSYAIYMDDLIFYKGGLGSMIANQRAVFVPKEIKIYNLGDPDFFLIQETDDQLNLIEINLEDNQTMFLQDYPDTQVKKGLNSQEDEWENMPAQRQIRPRPTLHYFKPKYQRDPQTREFFIQDSFQSEINIKTPDVQFLDPYIISVEDKTRIFVYSSVDPDRYYIYDLELHFELFVEVGSQSIIINEITYYPHQVSLFLTFDLESNQHRLECLILPSYDQMSHNRQANMRQVFIHYRFPYKIDLDPKDPYDISTVGDLALSAQFQQIPKRKGKFVGDRKNFYQDILVLQTQESILIYDLQASGPCSQRGKYLTNLSQLPMIRANENAVQTIVCGIESTQNVSDQYAKQKIEDNGYPTIYFAYLNGTDSYPNRAGIYMLKIKSKTFGKTQGSGKANDIEGDETSSQQKMPRPYLIYEFPPSSLSTEDRILAMSISDKDKDGVSLLIMDNTFAIKVLKLEIKDRKWKLRVAQTSIQPLMEVERIWNRLTYISHGEDTRPRIILTDQGAYLESHFSAFISSGSFQVEAQLEFEAKRDTKLSQRLKARDETSTRIWLNGDGVRSSQGHMLMWYRREKTMSSKKHISHLQSMKSRKTIRKMTVKNIGVGNRIEAAPLIPQKPKVSEQHYFLVASEMRSRVKRLMSDANDDFVRDHVVFTSFIGNIEDDDIFVVLKNGRYLIFDNSGSVVRLEVENNDGQHTLLGQKELSQFTIVDTLNLRTNNENFLKLLMLNQETNEYVTAELKSSLPRANFIMSNAIMLSTDTNPRQKTYRFKINNEDNSGLLDGQIKRPKDMEHQEYIYKFDTKGNVCKFVYPKLVKFDTRYFKGFRLNDSDFTLLTLNLNYDKKINLMIKEIIEKDIEFQISENVSRKYQKNQQLNSNEQVLLSEDIEFNRSDFDFIDLKAQMEINEMTKQIRYFVFRYKNEVLCQRFVMDVEFQKDSKGVKIDNTVSETFKLDLKLRKAGIITQFLPVDNMHHIQFMFYDPTCKRFFLFTWDLQANREVKMLKFEKTQDNPSYFQLTRGTSLRQNYIAMHGVDKIYDLHLEFPQNFISGQRLWGYRRDFEIDNSDSNLKEMSEEKFKNLLFRQAQSQMHEIKANYDGSSFLGLRKSTQTQLHRGFSLFDLQYIDYILKEYNLESQSFKDQSGDLSKPLILEYLNVQLPYNTNIVHIYHRSTQFLGNLLRELTDRMQLIKRDPKTSHADQISPFLYYSLIPLTLTEGVEGKRGLSMVLKGNLGECFELMVQMLMLDPHGINYMSHIKPYIIKFLSYDSDIIRNFLQSKCSKQLYSLRLTADQQEKNFENYMGTNSEYINLEENEESEKSEGKECSGIILKATISNRLSGSRFDQRQSEDEHQEIEGQKRIIDELVKQNKTQMKQINLYSYDFEGYLVGERSKLFLSYIVQQDKNLRIFDLNYIKIYLDYQWRKLKNRYFWLLFAYVLNNILMVVYVAFQQIKLTCTQDDYENDLCLKSLIRIFQDLYTFTYFSRIFYVSRIFLLVLSVIIICIEFIRLKNQNNYMNRIFWWINIAFIVKQLADIVMEFIFIHLMGWQTNYIKLYLEDPKSLLNPPKERWQIRILNIPIFLIKASNSLFMVALPMQFLYKVRYLPGMSIYLPKFFIAIEQIRGLVVIFITFTFSFMFSYTILTMLDLRTDFMDIYFAQWAKDVEFQIIKILQTVFEAFIQIMIVVILCFSVTMTMYIGAAMIKADQKATEEFEQLKLINLARLIVENELLINRKKLYENVHYVIHSDVKKKKIRSAFMIMNSKDQEQNDKKSKGGKRQKRKCCASIMQGQPIELVYEAK